MKKIGVALAVGLFVFISSAQAIADSMLATGDSNTLGNEFSSGSATAWPAISAELLGEGTPTVMALAGGEIQDVAPLVYANRPSSANTESVLFIGVNNNNFNGAGSAFLADFQNMLTALDMWSGSNAENFNGAADITCTSHWSPTGAYGHQGVASSVAGDTCTLTQTGPQGGLGYIMQDGGPGAITVTVDGSVVPVTVAGQTTTCTTCSTAPRATSGPYGGGLATYLGSLPPPAPPSPGSGLGPGFMSWNVGGSPTTVHSVTITQAANGVAVYLDWLWRGSSGFPVFNINLPWRNDNGSRGNADVAAYNAVIAASIAAAQSLGVNAKPVIDLASKITLPEHLLAADNFHLSQLTEAALAGMVKEAVSQ